jgi:hypothetical protein
MKFECMAIAAAIGLFSSVSVAERAPATDGKNDSKAESGSSEALAKKDDEAESAAKIGKDYGIESFDPLTGFSLSSEARKNFDVDPRAIEGNGPWAMPSGAIVTSGLEENLYRLRDGKFKRIDFELLQKVGSDQVSIKSKFLKAGDSICTKNLGFLRIVEIAASGDGSSEHAK